MSKYRRFTIIMPDDLAIKLKRLARESDQSMASVVRTLIRNADLATEQARGLTAGDTAHVLPGHSTRGREVQHMCDSSSPALKRLAHLLLWASVSAERAQNQTQPDRAISADGGSDPAGAPGLTADNPVDREDGTA